MLLPQVEQFLYIEHCIVSFAHQLKADDSLEEERNNMNRVSPRVPPNTSMGLSMKALPNEVFGGTPGVA